ncbi:MAG: hypothetical protein ACK5IP_02115 [Paracoccus sp. (in: a-proteobacteria)]
MSDPSEIPPGTAEAVAAGCTCQQADGEYCRNPIWPGWVVDDCPLHDPRSELEKL